MDKEYSYSTASLDAVLDELRRTRELQSARIANLQNRAGLLIGSSGIAAGLVSSVATDGWWIAPIGAFVASALFGVVAIFPRTGLVVHPGRVLESANGLLSIQVKTTIAAGIVSEYLVQERKLAWPAIFLRMSAVVFVIAIVLILAVALGGSPTVRP